MQNLPQQPPTHTQSPIQTPDPHIRTRTHSHKHTPSLPPALTQPPVRRQPRCANPGAPASRHQPRHVPHRKRSLLRRHQEWQGRRYQVWKAKEEALNWSIQEFSCSYRCISTQPHTTKTSWDCWGPITCSFEIVRALAYLCCLGTRCIFYAGTLPSLSG